MTRIEDFLVHNSVHGLNYGTSDVRHFLTIWILDKYLIYFVTLYTVNLPYGKNYFIQS